MVRFPIAIYYLVYYPLGIFIDGHINSAITLFGRPVRQLVNANISSANHLAATRNALKHADMVKRFGCFSDQIRMWKKCDLSDFDDDCWCQAGFLTISETANLLRFSRPIVSGVRGKCK